MSEYEQYVKTTAVESNEVDVIFPCPKCGMTATHNTYVEFLYEYCQETCIYVLIECIGDHPKFPVPFEWFIKYINEHGG